MLKLIEKKGSMVAIRKCPLTAGQRVSRRYRRALIRRAEYKKLKAIVPSISTKQKVSKVTVIEEAIKYIDELHKALYSRMPALTGSNVIPPFLNMSPQHVVAHMLRAAPSLTTLDSASRSRQPPMKLPGASNSRIQAHRPVKIPSVAAVKFSTVGSRSSTRCVGKQLEETGGEASYYQSNRPVNVTDGSNSDLNIIQVSNPTTAGARVHIRTIQNMSVCSLTSPFVHSSLSNQSLDGKS